ncbi:formamidopyrimidine-DNA glycosylase-like isoform X1 [Salvia splendens]|uniref:formamidopyrimidine-DNA glycosylase-like isoform X1 n=1 Tax=Salvia splendens TaxID=180675 RepID=UPI001C270F95|nr:formamidopyrimidine-DNA glycosylase-like isoform X1 [Salvia splendens]
MPELPEVEAARRALAENTIGKKIIKAIVADDSKVIDGVSPKDFEAALVGKTILAVHRKGKNMWIQLDSPPFPSFQFGMAGAVYIKGVVVTKYKRSAVKDTDEWPSKYSKLFVELADGMEFSFTDKRRFAKVRLLDNVICETVLQPVSVPPISELGPDALMEPMTEDDLSNSLRKKNIGIKALLLDQSFISGIGNWMADEVLYQARIHPQQTASSLSKESCATLLKCINEVTEKALEVGADSSQFPDDWIFHSREKKPGKAFVDGKKIDFIKAGGRTTAYVPELQKLSGIQAVKETDKRSKRTTAGNGGGVDESGSEDEPTEPKVTKGRKIGGASKSSKKKPSASVEDSDGDEGDDVSSKRKRGAKKPPTKSKPKGGKTGEAEQRQTRGKGAAAKRKHEEVDDNLSNSGENGIEDGEEDA